MERSIETDCPTRLPVDKTLVSAQTVPFYSYMYCRALEEMRRGSYLCDVSRGFQVVTRENCDDDGEHLRAG